MVFFNEILKVFALSIQRVSVLYLFVVGDADISTDPQASDVFKTVTHFSCLLINFGHKNAR